MILQLFEKLSTERGYNSCQCNKHWNVPATLQNGEPGVEAVRGPFGRQ